MFEGETQGGKKQFQYGVFILSSLFQARLASFVRLNVSFITSVTTVLKAASLFPRRVSAS